MPSSPDSDRGFSLHVTITVDPSNIDAFLAAFRPCYEAVTAEPDCTYFEVFHSLDEPGVFRFVENWSKSPEWFREVICGSPAIYNLLTTYATQNQLTKEYYKPYLEATQPMWVKDRKLNFFERFSKEWTMVKAINFG
jgi:quinol monooxygenase YgiN